MSASRHVILFLAILPLKIDYAVAAEKVYLGDRLGQVVMEVDTGTGDRRLIEMEDYPRILTARIPVAETIGAFLFVSFDATERSAIRRYRLPSGPYEGVSGFTDFNSLLPQGAGPNIPFVRSDIVFTRDGAILFLHPTYGPIEIDLASGDRRLLAGPVNPVTGANPPLLEGLDLVLESPDSILIADRFQGIFRMDRATGDLEIAFPSTDFLSSPYNIERLPSGQILHSLNQDDHNLYLFDPDTKQDKILSAGGPFPVGSGDPFVVVWDISVDNAGRIYVYDLGIPAIFEVIRATGERILVSSAHRGEGPPLLADFSLPTLSAGIETRTATSHWLLR